MPLDEAVQLISEDVKILGLSVPSMHGERGEFQVFNLMGSAIGDVEMSFRLLSLGMGLMSHIPHSTVVKVKPEAVHGDGDTALKVSEAAEIVLHDIQSASKPVQVNMLSLPPTSEQVTQTEHEHWQTVATQTAKKARVRQERNSSEFCNGVFVTNTVCPPPLFYNSEAEAKMPANLGLTFVDGTIMPTGGTRTHFANGARSVTAPLNGFDREDNFSEFSDSTIRHEDKFSDSESPDEAAADLSHTRSPVRKTLVRSSPEDSRRQLVSRVAAIQSMNVLGNVTQFPLLHELMKEIAGLQALRTSGTSVLTAGGVPPGKARPAWDTPTSPKAARAQESREAFLRRLSTPRDAEEHPGYHKGKRSCAVPHKGVPKHKSWLRKDPDPKKKETEYGVKKTKLVYGLTNTQRLRLAKGNPEWLKMQEKKLDVRWPDRNKNVKSQEEKREVAKPKAKQRTSISAKKVFKLDLPELQADTDVQSPKQRRRPVPTPRLSLSGEKRLQQIKEHFSSEKRRLTKEMEKLSHTPTDYRSSENSFHTAQPSDQSEKSAHTNDTSAENSDFEKTAKSPLGNTKVLSGPTLPRDVHSRLSMVSSYSEQYSDDFEDDFVENARAPVLRRVEETRSGSSSESAQEPSLRKVVETYSDEGDEPSLRKVVEKHSEDDTQASGEEPTLRKVVDRYSSDEQDSSKSYRSAASRNSGQKAPPGVRALPLPNPTSSLRSPVLHHSVPSGTTRDGIVASESSTGDSDSDEDSSTARIPRSQMPSQSFETGTSLDSTGEWKRRRQQPRPSPRRSLERIRTESVSSYNPSEHDNLSPIPSGDLDDLVSEEPEEDEPPRRAREATVPPKTKALGYTWT